MTPWRLLLLLALALSNAASACSEGDATPAAIVMKDLASSASVAKPTGSLPIHQPQEQAREQFEGERRWPSGCGVVAAVAVVAIIAYLRQGEAALAAGNPVSSRLADCFDRGSLLLLPGERVDCLPRQGSCHSMLPLLDCSVSAQHEGGHAKLFHAPGQHSGGLDFTAAIGQGTERGWALSQLQCALTSPLNTSSPSEVQCNLAHRSSSSASSCNSHASTVAQDGPAWLETDDVRRPTPQPLPCAGMLQHPTERRVHLDPTALDLHLHSQQPSLSTASATSGSSLPTPYPAATWVDCIAASVPKASPASPAPAPRQTPPAQLRSEDEQQGTFLGFEELCDLSAAAGPLPGSPAQARPHRQRAAGGPAKAGSAPPRLQLDLLRLLAGDGGQAAGQQRRLNSSVLAKVLPGLLSLEHSSQSFPPPGYSSSVSSSSSSKPTVLYTSRTAMRQMSLKVEDAPGPCTAVARQLNRATGFAILSTNASRTRGTCISHVSTLCVDGCIQQVAWVVTLPLQPPDPPSLPSAPLFVAPATLSQAVLAAAVQVCTQAGHFGVKALDTQAADKSGGVAGDDCGSDGSSFHADGYGQSAWVGESCLRLHCWPELVPPPSLSHPASPNVDRDAVASAADIAAVAVCQGAGCVWASPACLVAHQPACVTLTFLMPHQRSSDEHAAPAAGNTSSLDAGPMLVRALGVVRGQLVLDQQLWAHPCQESAVWEARLQVPGLILPGSPALDGQAELAACLPVPLHIHLLSHVDSEPVLPHSAPRPAAHTHLPTGMLLASTQLFLGSERLATELAQLQDNMQAEAAAQASEPQGAQLAAGAGGAGNVPSRVWMRHLAPLMQDLGFLLATAPQAADLLGQQGREEHSAAEQSKAKAWCDLATQLLLYFVEHGAMAWAQATFDVCLAVSGPAVTPGSRTTDVQLSESDAMPSATANTTAGPGCKEAGGGWGMSLTAVAGPASGGAAGAPGLPCPVTSGAPQSSRLFNLVAPTLALAAGYSARLLANLMSTPAAPDLLPSPPPVSSILGSYAGQLLVSAVHLLAAAVLVPAATALATLTSQLLFPLVSTLASSVDPASAQGSNRDGAGLLAAGTPAPSQEVADLLLQGPPTRSVACSPVHSHLLHPLRALPEPDCLSRAHTADSVGCQTESLGICWEAVMADNGARVAPPPAAPALAAAAVTAAVDVDVRVALPCPGAKPGPPSGAGQSPSPGQLLGSSSSPAYKLPGCEPEYAAAASLEWPCTSIYTSAHAASPSNEGVSASMPGTPEKQGITRLQDSTPLTEPQAGGGGASQQPPVCGCSPTLSLGTAGCSNQAAVQQHDATNRSSGSSRPVARALGLPATAASEGRAAVLSQAPAPQSLAFVPPGSNPGAVQPGLLGLAHNALPPLYPRVVSSTPSSDVPSLARPPLPAPPLVDAAVMTMQPLPEPCTIGHEAHGTAEVACLSTDAAQPHIVAGALRLPDQVPLPLDDALFQQRTSQAHPSPASSAVTPRHIGEFRPLFSSSCSAPGSHLGGESAARSPWGSMDDNPAPGSGLGTCPSSPPTTPPAEQLDSPGPPDLSALAASPMSAVGSSADSGYLDSVVSRSAAKPAPPATLGRVSSFGTRLKLASSATQARLHAGVGHQGTYHMPPAPSAQLGPGPSPLAISPAVASVLPLTSPDPLELRTVLGRSDADPLGTGSGQEAAAASRLARLRHPLLALGQMSSPAVGFDSGSSSSLCLDAVPAPRPRSLAMLGRPSVLEAVRNSLLASCVTDLPPTSNTLPSSSLPTHRADEGLANIMLASRARQQGPSCGTNSQPGQGTAAVAGCASALEMTAPVEADSLGGQSGCSAHSSVPQAVGRELVQPTALPVNDHPSTTPPAAAHTQVAPAGLLGSSGVGGEAVARQVEPAGEADRSGTASAARHPAVPVGHGQELPLLLESGVGPRAAARPESPFAKLAPRAPLQPSPLSPLCYQFLTSQQETIGEGCGVGRQVAGSAKRRVSVAVGVRRKSGGMAYVDSTLRPLSTEVSACRSASEHLSRLMPKVPAALPSRRAPLARSLAPSPTLAPGTAPPSSSCSHSGLGRSASSSEGSCLSLAALASLARVGSSVAAPGDAGFDAMDSLSYLLTGPEPAPAFILDASANPVGPPRVSPSDGGSQSCPEMAGSCALLPCSGSQCDLTPGGAGGVGGRGAAAGPSALHLSQGDAGTTGADWASSSSSSRGHEHGANSGAACPHKESLHCGRAEATVVFRPGSAGPGCSRFPTPSARPPSATASPLPPAPQQQPPSDPGPSPSAPAPPALPLLGKAGKPVPRPTLPRSPCQRSTSSSALLMVRQQAAGRQLASSPTCPPPPPAAQEEQGEAHLVPGAARITSYNIECEPRLWSRMWSSLNSVVPPACSLPHAATEHRAGGHDLDGKQGSEVTGGHSRLPGLANDPSPTFTTLAAQLPAPSMQPTAAAHAASTPLASCAHDARPGVSPHPDCPGAASAPPATATLANSSGSLNRGGRRSPPAATLQLPEEPEEDAVWGGGLFQGQQSLLASSQNVADYMLSVTTGDGSSSKAGQSSTTSTFLQELLNSDKDLSGLQEGLGTGQATPSGCSLPCEGQPAPGQPVAGISESLPQRAIESTPSRQGTQARPSAGQIHSISLPSPPPSPYCPRGGPRRSSPPRAISAPVLNASQSHPPPLALVPQPRQPGGFSGFLLPPQTPGCPSGREPPPSPRGQPASASAFLLPGSPGFPPPSRHQGHASSRLSNSLILPSTPSHSILSDLSRASLCSSDAGLLDWSLGGALVAWGGEGTAEGESPALPPPSPRAQATAVTSLAAAMGICPPPSPSRHQTQPPPSPLMRREARTQLGEAFTPRSSASASALADSQSVGLPGAERGEDVGAGSEEVVQPTPQWSSQLDLLATGLGVEGSSGAYPSSMLLGSDWADVSRHAQGGAGASSPGMWSFSDTAAQMAGAKRGAGKRRAPMASAFGAAPTSPVKLEVVEEGSSSRNSSHQAEQELCGETSAAAAAAGGAADPGKPASQGTAASTSHSAALPSAAHQPSSPLAASSAALLLCREYSLAVPSQSGSATPGSSSAASSATGSGRLQCRRGALSPAGKLPLDLQVHDNLSLASSLVSDNQRPPSLTSSPMPHLSAVGRSSGSQVEGARAGAQSTPLSPFKRASMERFQGEEAVTPPLENASASALQLLICPAARPAAAASGQVAVSPSRSRFAIQADAAFQMPPPSPMRSPSLGSTVKAGPCLLMAPPNPMLVGNLDGSAVRAPELGMPPPSPMRSPSLGVRHVLLLESDMSPPSPMRGPHAAGLHTSFMPPPSPLRSPMHIHEHAVILGEASNPALTSSSPWPGPDSRLPGTADPHVPPPSPMRGPGPATPYHTTPDTLMPPPSPMRSPAVDTVLNGAQGWLEPPLSSSLDRAQSQLLGLKSEETMAAQRAAQGLVWPSTASDLASVSNPSSSPLARPSDHNRSPSSVELASALLSPCPSACSSGHTYTSNPTYAAARFGRCHSATSHRPMPSAQRKPPPAHCPPRSATSMSGTIALDWGGWELQPGRASFLGTAAAEQEVVSPTLFPRPASRAGPAAPASLSVVPPPQQQQQQQQQRESSQQPIPPPVLAVNSGAGLGRSSRAAQDDGRVAGVLGGNTSCLPTACQQSRGRDCDRQSRGRGGPGDRQDSDHVTANTSAAEALLAGPVALMPCKPTLNSSSASLLVVKPGGLKSLDRDQEAARSEDQATVGKACIPEQHAPHHELRDPPEFDTPPEVDPELLRPAEAVAASISHLTYLLSPLHLCNP